MTGTTVTLSGDVTATGGGTITERGVVYATTSNPTTGNFKVAHGTPTTGAFSINASGLLQGTTYHYRAYAINTYGTGYGADQTFTTSQTRTVSVFTDTVPGTPAGTGAGAAGDLRSTLLAAGAGDTIVFSGAGTVTLNGPLPPITVDLTIDGGSNVVIDGNSLYRAFFIDSGTVTIKNLTIRNVRAKGGDGATGGGGGGGGAGLGAGIFINKSTANVTVDHVTFLNTAAVGGNGAAPTAAVPGGGGGGLGANGALGSSDIGGGGGGGGGVLGAGTVGGAGNTGDGGNGGLGGGGAGGVGVGMATGGTGGAAYAGNNAGSPNSSSTGGAGGFGGGGGAAARFLTGGAGGFGGGGGSGGSTGGKGGAGGPGGGGGGAGISSSTAYAGGAGGSLGGGVSGGAGTGSGTGSGSNPNIGGGGAAAGPAIFVNLGTLTTITSSSLSATATGGTGGSSGNAGGADATATFNYGGTVNGSGTTGPVGSALAGAPVLTAPTSANVAATDATLGATVSSDGAPLTETGIVYSVTTTNANPIIGGTGVTKVPAAGTSTGVFTTPVSGLAATTGYTYAAYAINFVGTGYSATNTFTTAAPSPTISSVTAPTAGSYHVGDVLTFTVNVGTALTVTGSPRIQLSLGGATAYATYTAVGSTSTALKFTYTVQLNDNAGAGIIAYNTIDLNGGTINATSGGYPLVTSFTAPSGNSVIVDGVKPVIVASPASRSIGIGGTSKTTLTVAATGNGLSYQWRKDTFNISSANAATYTINPVQVSDAGVYDCVVTNANGSATSGTGTITVLPNPIVYNASVNVGATGASAHFTIEGSVGKQVLVAAYGPALTSVSGAIADPRISLTKDGSPGTTFSNDNWGTIDSLPFSTLYARLGLPSLASGSKDAVLTATLTPGSYTVTVTGVGGATGAAVIALADADLNPPSRLAYVSFRGTVAPGTPLTGGFRMTSSADKKLLVRAIGPSLSAGGLADPSLTVYDSDGTTVAASNNNWGGTTPLKNAFTQAGAFALGDASLDAAVLGQQRIGTGSYTVQATSTSGSGDVLLEVYDLNGSTPAATAPVIGSPLADITASSGPVTFSVGVSGGLPITYSWAHGSTPIPSATSSTLTLNSITTADAGSYTVTVSNSLTSTATLRVIPAVNSAGTGTPTYGTPYSYTITGTNSPTSFNATGLPTGLSVDTATGAITGSPTQLGTFTVALSATNADGTGTGSLSLTVGKKALTVSGVAATSKTYDASVMAALTTTSAALVGVYGADQVTLNTASATGSFADKAVGTAKTVTVAGLGLTGPDSGNYTLTQPTTTANITAKALSIAGVTAVSTRIYDGTTVAGLSGTAAFLSTEAAGAGTTSDGKPYSVDTISVGGTAAGAFADRNVGTAKAITVTGLTVAGTDAANYTATQPTGLSADVTAKALTIAGLSGVASRTYDGTTVAGLTGTAAFLSTEAAGAGATVDGKPYSVDTISVTGTAAGAFANRNVGTAKAITVTGLGVGGTDSGNYTAVQPTGLTGTITAKALTVAGVTASDKIYNATTTATLGGTAAFLSSEAAGAGTTSDGKPYSVDTIAIGGTAAGTFADKDVATGKAITVTGVTVTGTDAANYSVTQPTGLTAAVTKKTLTVSGVTAANKVYDGTTAATLSGTPTLQSAEAPGAGTTADGKPYTGDTFSAAGTLTGTFADRAAATGKTVAVAGVTLTGAQSGNYDVGALTTTADITPKALTISGVAAVATRIYDGTTVAGLTGTPAFTAAEATGLGTTSDGIPYTVDSVTVGGTAAGAFADRNVGTAKAITVTGLTVTGTGAANYTATQPTGLTADVTAKALNVAGLTAVPTRVYDTTAVAGLLGTPAFLPAETAGTGTTIDGTPYTVDSISLTGTAAGAFATKMIGTGKAITVTGVTVSGTDSANYTVTQPTGLTADVTAAGLTISGITASNKIYDGNVTASLNAGTAALVGVLPGDTVTLSGTATGTFANKTVGTAKTVQVAALSLTGTDAGNYTVTQPTTTANITAKTLTVAGITAAGKVYDGNTTATPTYTGAIFTGVVSGDTVTLVITGATATFSSKTVAPLKTVTFASLTLGGADAGNYTLTQPTTTAGITAKILTVTGITANNKIYNGNTSASLNTGSASLVGVVSGDTTTVVTGGAIGTFSDANVGLNKAVQVSGLTLAGADAGNYSVTQPSTTATITPASASIAISNLSFTYDGTPKSATITISPNVAASIVYSNGGSAPTNAGTYTVSVNVTDGNYSGSANAQLVIAKATQALAFNITGSDFKVGATLGLSATASSGLPVTFAVTSGAATISGSNVTITQTGAVTIRATQAGNDNYLAVTADRGFTGVSAAKTAQTIAFGALPNVRSDSGGFTLSATASSGLPVSFTVVSGPATLIGSGRLVLSGATGLVVVRASQAGDATFAAAPDVVRAFAVTLAIPDIFFGDLTDDPGVTDNRGELAQSAGPRPEAKAGDIAAAIFAGTNRGTLLIVAPSLSLNVSLDLTFAADGTYSVPFTSAGRSLVVTGSLTGSVLTGRIATLKVSFTTTVQTKVGVASTLAGIYETDAVNSASGGTATIVGANGQILVVANTGTLSAGAAGTVNTDGTFNLAATGATISGAVDAPTTTVSGTITVTGQAPVSFAGVSAGSRTDRLINLSARVSVAPNRTLITGFVIGGTEAKRVLIRGVGPALTSFGVTGALTNPKLQLFDSASKLLLENDDWSGADTAAAFAQVGAFVLPAGSKDAAVLTTLAPGAYTVQITGGTETGVALAEIYDASADAGAETQRLINISTRGTVDTGANGLLIGGFVVTGNTPKKVLIRGVGPGLTAFGVTGTVTDPRLAVYNGSTLVAQNDDWSTAQPLNAQQSVATAAELSAAAQSVGAFALGAGTKDAALIITLAPGAYTAQVSGANGGTGAAIVEVYELP